MTDKCSICLEELRSNIGAITPCGHCFHRECFYALKKNQDKNNDANNRNTDKLPRCPICKQKSKKFVDIYLTFQERDGTSNNNNRSKSNSSSNKYSTNNQEEGVGIGCSSSSYAEATQALASLTSENMRLRKSLHEMKSMSKGQNEILHDVLPKFDELQTQLSKTTQDKEQIEKELKEVEEENSELLTGWNDIEMKMQLVKIEKDELEDKLRETKQRNDELCIRWNELDQKLNRAKKKRKLIELKQIDEVQVMKYQITQSNFEKEELCTMLKKTQTKATELKRTIKKLKRKQSKGEKINQLNQKKHQFQHQKKFAERQGKENCGIAIYN